ncbi:hypothetical protein [Acinetobacter sp. YH12239]|uniref:hypothetical protein n=1 Tax=Acinetobacter sp. YH12239 TaxID=2601166 RepID=UPI0015D3AF82|nr:hypothetical protein [Acinetobacter sp. YH12239]
MKKLMTLASLATTTILLSACASTPTETLAIQKPNNQYEVSGLGKTQVLAKNNAISAANKTCGKNSSPVLIDEKTEYNGALKGVVDEQTGKLITAASSVLGSVIGTKNTIEKDTDYQTTITFSCNTTR